MVIEAPAELADTEVIVHDAAVAGLMPSLNSTGSVLLVLLRATA